MGAIPYGGGGFYPLFARAEKRTIQMEDRPATWPPIIGRRNHMIDLFSVRSSVIAAAGYDPQKHILLVLYNTGRTYEYHSVPPNIFWGLMSSESKGKFLNEQVLGKFPYKLFRGWQMLSDESGLRMGRARRSSATKPVETVKAG